LADGEIAGMNLSSFIALCWKFTESNCTGSSGGLDINGMYVFTRRSTDDFYNRQINYNTI
jgi:hypothetical protein